MRQARRLFGKNKNLSLDSSSSSVFKSKILRDLPNQAKVNPLGPGQYDVSFPIVKPKFEAIRKNNNTVIIKVNNKCSPVFQSLQPRFKQDKTNKNQNTLLEEANQVIHQRSQRKYIQTQKISNGMRNRIQKLSQILSVQNRQSKKSLANDETHQKSAQKLEGIEPSSEVINSLKLYKKERERLHFLLKYIKPNNSKKKGVQWSKYRQTKGNLYNVNNVPGPGAYDQKDYRTTNHRYFQTIQQKSWQFKSLTRRGYYLNQQQKKYELSARRNRFLSDINGKFYKVDSIRMFNDRSQQKLSIDNDQI